MVYRILYNVIDKDILHSVARCNFAFIQVSFRGAYITFASSTIIRAGNTVFNNKLSACGDCETIISAMGREIRQMLWTNLKSQGPPRCRLTCSGLLFTREEKKSWNLIGKWLLKSGELQSIVNPESRLPHWLSLCLAQVSTVIGGRYRRDDASHKPPSTTSRDALRSSLLPLTPFSLSLPPLGSCERG